MSAFTPRYLAEEGCWCVDVLCDGDDVEIAIAGSRSAPHPGCLAQARAVADRLPDLRAESRAAVVALAAELGRPASARWEMIAAQVLDREAPETWSAVWNEPVHDLYGWWEVRFDGATLLGAERQDM